MDQQELLSTFNNLVDRYRQHRIFIQRARTHAEKFSGSVVEKVIIDHERNSTAVAEDILPVVPEIENAIATVDEQISSIQEALECMVDRLHAPLAEQEESLEEAKAKQKTEEILRCMMMR